MSGFLALADLPRDLPAADADIAPRRVPIATLGSYQDRRYGRFAITADQAERWRENMQHLGGEVAIDFDHSADTPGAGRNTEAAAWIRDPRVEGDTVTAEMELTPKGAQAIRDKTYRYFSPTFAGSWTDEEGVEHKDVLLGGAFTNRPKLRKRMPAITLSEEAEGDFPIEFAQRIQLATAPEKHHPLDERGQFAKKVGAMREGEHMTLPAGTAIHKGRNDSYVVARKPGEPGEQFIGHHVAARQALNHEQGHLHEAMHSPQVKRTRQLSDTQNGERRIVGSNMPDLQTIARKLSLDDAADADSIVRKLDEVVILAADDHADLERRATEGDTVRQERDDERFTTAWTRALDEGRVAPAEEDGIKGLRATSGTDAVIAMLDQRPQIVPTRPAGVTGEPADDAAGRAAVEGVNGDRQNLHERALALSEEKGIPYPEAAIRLADEEVR